MRDMLRRIARLESERADSPDAKQAEAEAAATEQLTEIMNAIAAEKSAGDPHGIADRMLAEILAETRRQP